MATKFIFFSGKEGVGKTSMACTAAVYYADMGKKTLIVNADPAANLADAFEQEIGHKITSIKDINNLYAMEIDPYRATTKYKERLLAPLKELLNEEMFKIAEEQLGGTCMKEMASIDKFIDFMEDATYDVIIFDTAPTEHTIRLLKLSVDWNKQIEKCSKGIAQACMKSKVLIQKNKNKFDEAIAKLQDKNQTEMIFVLKANQTSLSESTRALLELRKFGITASSLIINGIIPLAEIVNSFLEHRYDMQQAYIIQIRATFRNVKTRMMERFDEELKGITMFRKSGAILFTGVDNHN